MKKLIGWLMAATFCGAASLVWADAAGNSNKANPQFLPPGQKQKVISGHNFKVKPVPKGNGLDGGKRLPTTKTKVGAKTNEEEGIYYYSKHAESGHKLVTGKTGKDGKYNPKTVKKAGRENLVNYTEGDTDKPIVTGKGGKDASLNPGGKTIHKISGPKDRKHAQPTVKTAGKEVLVNYSEGDPDKPIVTGNANNRAVTTSVRQGSPNEKSAKEPGL